MRDDLDAWLDAHWDPDLTVGAWWALLAEAGWTEPSARFAERGVLGPPGGTAVMVVLPAIIEHATAAQSPELARPILDGRAAWCLLLSEPGAGTDLAALTTAAVRGEVGGGWAVVQTAVTAERRSVGGHRGATARTGTAGDLDRRAGDFVGTAPLRRDDDRPSEA